MRYRVLDANGDYVMGKPGEFLVDSAAGVAQACRTRLLLMAGEWFLDDSEGTPYMTQILGFHTTATRDVAIQNRISGTPGVKSILAYASRIDSRRKMTVTATVDTIYGTAILTGTF